MIASSVILSQRGIAQSLENRLKECRCLACLWASAWNSALSRSRSSLACEALALMVVAGALAASARLSGRAMALITPPVFGLLAVELFPGFPKRLTLACVLITLARAALTDSATGLWLVNVLEASFTFRAGRPSLDLIKVLECSRRW